MTTPQSLSLQLLAACAYNEAAIAVPSGYHSVDIPELHNTQSPALFDYAKRIAQFENARLQPLLKAVADVVGACELAREFYKCDTYDLPPPAIALDMALEALRAACAVGE